MVTAKSEISKSTGSQKRLSIFASVKLSVFLLSVTAVTVLIGAWCPQTATVGSDKVMEQFGPELGAQMIKYGIADIFHSPFFLGLIGMVFINLVVASFQRVFPKLRLLKQAMPFLGRKEISRMSIVEERIVGQSLSISNFVDVLRRSGYFVKVVGNKATGHWGKFGRLAPTVTHIGLLSLLAGVTITSWTGFGGFQAIDLHEEMHFSQSEHAKMWVGKLPNWHIRVDSTRREDYPSGDPKQWYSVLTVLDDYGRELKKQEISVNNPLTYEGVDIYQSSWGLHQIKLSFNGHSQKFDLRQMGPKVNAAFLPLDAQTIMIFSVRGQDQPVRVFAKSPQWPQPRILTVLTKGQSQKLGAVNVCYEELIPMTGLQYKCDPGLPITYIAFGFITLGVLLAAVPYRQVWVALEALPDGSQVLVAGGISKKAERAFSRSLQKMCNKIAAKYPPLGCVLDGMLPDSGLMQSTKSMQSLQTAACASLNDLQHADANSISLKRDPELVAVGASAGSSESK